MNSLAIVIPYYKIDFFEETLKSVAAQTDKRFTLYIGNDASKNDPLELIQKYFPDGNYHYFDYKENLGGKNLAMQWERILENVTEEWFEILGDDDCITNNFVETFYKILPQVEKENIDIIKSGLHWINDHNELLEKNVYNFDTITSAELFIKKYYGEIKGSLSENIYRTKIAKKVKFTKLPLAWGSDDLSLLDFTRNGIVKYIPKHLIDIRISTANISGSRLYDLEKQMAHHQLSEKILIKYKGHLPDYFIRKTLEDYLSQAYYKGFFVNSNVLLFYLKKLEITNFLKAARKIYYIRKKISSKT